MKVKRIYDGKVFWRIEKAPFYSSGVDAQKKVQVSRGISAYVTGNYPLGYILPNGSM